jgi:hypothetical protein
MTIFGGALAASCVLGGFYLLARTALPVYAAPIIAGLLFIVAGGCFGVAFAWYLTGGRLPRLTLRSLFRRGTR